MRLEGHRLQHYQQERYGLQKACLGWVLLYMELAWHSYCLPCSAKHRLDSLGWHLASSLDQYGALAALVTHMDLDTCHWAVTNPCPTWNGGALSCRLVCSIGSGSDASKQGANIWLVNGPGPFATSIPLPAELHSIALPPGQGKGSGRPRGTLLA